MNQAVGRLAAIQQRQDFSAVENVLQVRRDQIQRCSIWPEREECRPQHRGAAVSAITGYAPSELDADPLSYAPQARHPLALVYKGPPAPQPGPSWAIWGQGGGDWEHVRPANSTDNFASTYTGLAGVDATWQKLITADDALVLGVVGNWTGSHVSFSGSPATVRLDGPGFGIYGTYVRGGFSIDAIGKFDFMQLTEDFGGLSAALGADLTNAGVSGNIQYKFRLAGNSFVEPTGGVSYTRTMFGGDAATLLGLVNGSTLRVQGGARAGTAWDTPSAIVEATLTGLVYSNVIAQGTNGLLAVGSVPTDEGKVRGEVDPKLNLDFRNGYTTFLDGSVRFGEGLLGGSAKIGLRKQW